MRRRRKDRQEAKLWLRRFGVGLPAFEKKKKRERKSPRQLQRNLCKLKKKEEKRTQTFFSLQEKSRKSREIIQKQSKFFLLNSHTLCWEVCSEPVRLYEAEEVSYFKTMEFHAVRSAQA